MVVADGAFQLPCAFTGEEHHRRMRVDALDGRAVMSRGRTQKRSDLRLVFRNHPQLTIDAANDGVRSP
jgi:hypothetical protein